MACALVAAYDLRTNLALHDEFMYRWTLEHVMTGHGLKLWPQLLPLSLVELTLNAAIWPLHLEPRWSRLLGLPFLGLVFIGTRATARRLGASETWALAGAAAITCSPLVLQVATSQVSDVYYFGLLAVVLYLGVRWLQTGRGAIALALVSTSAALQRQHGFGIGLAVLAVVLLYPELRGDRSRLRSTLAIFLVAVAVVLAPVAAGLYAAKAGAVASAPFSAGRLVGMFVEFGPLLGLVLLPLAVPLLFRPRAVLDAGRAQLAPFALAVAGIAGSLTFVLFFGTMVFPGDVIGNWGLGPIHDLPGPKTPLWPYPAFLFIEALAVAASGVFLVWRRGDWALMARSPERAFLLLAAASQAAPILLAGVGDRYYLPVFLALTPVLAAVISDQWKGYPGASAQRWSATGAAALVLVGIAVYAVGEDDYIRWQVARDAAADIAYREAFVNEVAGGYEEVATRYAVPFYSAHGALPADVNGYRIALTDPRLVLAFAPADDPRPGVVYGWILRGKIVIEQER